MELEEIYANDFSKRYYKIGDVAEILGLPVSTLRFWEKQFTVVKPSRNARGTRYYTVKDIETIRMIYFLVKEKGLRLDAAQEQIRVNRNNVSQRVEVLDRLATIRNTLAGMIESIDKMKL